MKKNNEFRASCIIVTIMQKRLRSCYKIDRFFDVSPENISMSFMNDVESRLNINAIKTNSIQIRASECRSPAYILALIQEFSPFPLKSHLSPPRHMPKGTYDLHKFKVSVFQSLRK